MSTVPISASDPAAEASRKTPLPLRPDTFFGVCEAIGEDLGFNANFLRIPLGMLLLWNPVAIVGCYFGLGLVVAATRWFFPAERKNVVQAKPEPGESKAVASAEEQESEELLAA
jgi:hypothetical protein